MYFFVCLSNLLFQAPEGALTGMVFPQINVHSCLRYTHMYAELPLCNTALPKAVCLCVVCTISEFMEKQRKKPSVKC